MRRREGADVRRERMRFLMGCEVRGSRGISRVWIQSMITFWVARRVLAQKGGYPKRHSKRIIPSDHLRHEVSEKLGVLVNLGRGRTNRLLRCRIHLEGLRGPCNSTYRQHYQRAFSSTFLVDQETPSQESVPPRPLPFSRQRQEIPRRHLR